MSKPFIKYRITRVIETTEIIDIEAMDESAARKVVGELEDPTPMLDIALIGDVQSEITNVTLTCVEKIGLGRKERWSTDCISKPDPKYDIKDYGFSADLRGCFRGSDNHVITAMLKKQKVIDRTVECDSESACTWLYFNKHDDAKAFLRRLNAFYRKTHSKVNHEK